MKKQVCKAYGVSPCPKQNTLEIDHLVPLELGGLDDTRNLWPEMAEYPDGAPGFHVKDKLENELKRRVCSQGMALPDAQWCIATNWIACYRKIFPGEKLTDVQYWHGIPYTFEPAPLGYGFDLRH